VANLVTPEQEAGLLAEIASLRRQVDDLMLRTDRADRNGLDQVIGRNLNYHPAPYVTDVPTGADADGSPRIVKTGGLYYAYWYADGAWRRVQIT